MALRKLLLSLLVFSIPFLTVSPRQHVLGLPAGVLFAVLAVCVMLLYSRELIAALLNVNKSKNIFENHSYSIARPWPVLLFTAIILLSFLGIVASGQVMSENYVRIAYQVFSALICWLVYVSAENQEDLRSMVGIYLIAAGIAALYGVYVTLGFMLGLNTGQEVTWTVPRLLGTATEAQVFGNFLLSVLPLTIGLCLLAPKGGSALEPTLRLFGFALFAIALIMTFSAGAWVGAAAGLVPLLLLVRQFRWRKVMAVLAMAGLVAVLLVSVDRWVRPGYLSAFQSIGIKFTEKAPEIGPGKPSASAPLPADTYRINMNSVNDRKWFREAAWKMFRSHPLTGIGVGNFGYQYNNYRPAGAPYYDIYARAHNQYLEILAETGLPGAVAFLLLGCHLLLLLFRVLVYGRDHYLKLLTVSLFASLAALAVHGWSFGILVHNYVWFLLGLTYAACRLSLANRGGTLYEYRD